MDPDPSFSMPTPQAEPSSLPPPVPDKQFGRYLLVSEIGRGGMGVVWKAYDTQLKRTVALKQVRSSGTHPGEDVERFLREAQLAAKLSHPNIIAVHDVGEHEGQHYLTMDLIEGKSLAQCANGSLPPRQVAEVLRPVAEALAHAHAHGIVHRDVKPSNILLDAAGSPHVTDFGLAKEVDLRAGGTRTDQLTRSGAVVGTPQYMSPEQAMGEANRMGPASDQFSFGIVLYQILTGRLPFCGSTEFETWYSILREDPVPPRRRRPEIPVDLQTICLKALEKEPSQRYASMSELSADLRRFLEGEPIQARPIPPIYRLARKARKHLAVAVPSALAAFLLVGVAAWRIVAKAHRSNEEAQAGLARSDSEVARMREEAERGRTALRKSGLVADVLARWESLTPALREIERLSQQRYASVDDLHCAEAPAWKPVQEFLEATPSDATSQSAARALAGWARRTAGSPEEGLAWMEEARKLDPDVPYGAILEIMACSADFLTGKLGRLGGLRVVMGGTDLPALLKEFSTGWDEPSRVSRPLLDEASRAPVWGKDIVEACRALQHAMGCMREGKFSEAEAELNSAHECAGLLPLRLTVLEFRAMTRALQMRMRPALSDLAEATQLDPYAPYLYVFRAGIHKAMNDLDAAIVDLTNALESTPCEEAALHFARAQIHQMKRDARAAMKDYDGAIAADPNYPEARLERGMLHEQLGEYNEAIEDLELATKAYPQDVGVMVSLAMARHASNDLDGAIRECERALSTDPLYAQAYVERGYAWKAKGNLQAAMMDYDAALRLQPDYPEALNNRGRLKYEMGDLGGAILDYDRAVKLRPAYPEAIANRGRAKEKQEDLAGAIADYQLALTTAPADWRNRASVEEWLKSAKERLGPK